jgi:hypothetical protein
MRKQPFTFSFSPFLPYLQIMGTLKPVSKFKLIFPSISMSSHFFVNVVVVEILIRAHDCYTAALNMEGIVAILRHARVLATNLLQRQKWALMVRTHLMHSSTPLMVTML